MSGGDLDGDEYLVVWDPSLLQFSSQIGSELPQSYEPPETKHETSNDDNLIAYLSRYDDIILGRIDSCFFKIAGSKGIKSIECQLLATIFSRAVDQYPSDLKKLEELCEKSKCAFSTNLMVWDQMKRAQFDIADDLKKRKDPSKDEWLKFFLSIIETNKCNAPNKLNLGFRWFACCGRRPDSLRGRRCRDRPASGNPSRRRSACTERVRERDGR